MTGFADRASEFRPSPVRTVFETALDPAVVSLAGGNPDLSLLPGGSIADLASSLLADRGPEILQYGSGAGTESLRALVVELMARRGSAITQAEVQPLAGSQAGLDLVTKLYCNPRDVVLAEGPTYVGALGVFGSYEVEVRHVDIDREGLDPDEVARALDQLAAEGRRVPFLYTVPTHQNPTGVTLPAERRRALVEVCASRGVLVVEDDPYGMLGFDRSAAAAPTLHSLDPENVIHLGSASKIFSPGLRVGWAVAPAQVRARMQIAAEAVLIHPSVLSQELTVAWLGSPQWPVVLDETIALYRERAEAATAALAAHLGDRAEWTEPSGGFFTWVRFPGTELGDILRRGIAEGVVIVPGAACYADGRSSDAVRVAYSGVSPERIDEGIRRLTAAVR
ncbi:PLP-dependent aminotransferase family protein [Kocuria coralli]|uniref:PLP-dependent aminotransferase family protein n=1 Tax=Kocuria coralli TaxID=1461025 RepID=A0A5J5KYP7_9MICC|nr:PLP-dependent aminotransferase family protein [Kocuria coralli]KAA9393926.1 PLP-dependent aminotransferase family protein [Kocuria coralli]